MQLTTITATYGGKINLGDFNSVHLELTLTAEVDPGDDGEQSIRSLFDTAKTAVTEQAKAYRNRATVNVKELMFGAEIEK